MHKLIILFLGALAALTICSHGAADVNFSSGKFSSNGHHMTTGTNGHAQVGLDGQGSLIRFGSNTVADVGNEREVTLSKGLLLVSSGEGFLRRSGVVIQTPEGQITVRGTVLVAVLPDGAVKLTCLEGSVKGDLGGQGFALHAGEMIIQRVNGIRDVVQVNLHTLTHTCALLDGGGFKPLHFAGSIDQAVTHQDKVLADTQHASGHGQGESGGFLARFFSFSSQSGNNSSNQAGVNMGGTTLTLSQTGGSSNSLSIIGAGGALTTSGAGSATTNLVASVQFYGGTNSLQVSTVPAGTFVQTQNNNLIVQNHPVDLQTGATLVSGSSLTLNNSSNTPSGAGGNNGLIITGVGFGGNNNQVSNVTSNPGVGTGILNITTIGTTIPNVPSNSVQGVFQGGTWIMDNSQQHNSVTTQGTTPP